MEVIIGKNAGFCFGVRNAVSKTQQVMKNEGKEIYCLGELVHNRQVIEELQKQGLKIVEQISQANRKLIIRAHGTEKKNYEIAKERKIELIDLTCPKVLKIHNMINDYFSDGYYTFLIGMKNHPETIGNMSFGENKISIIEGEDDIFEAINEVKEQKMNKILIISQTTFSIEKFEKYVTVIKRELNEEKYRIVIKNTICDATRIRQEETKKMARECDLMIIVGGKNSSNTQKLVEISKNECDSVYAVETSRELDTTIIKQFNKIGIMAGASTPQESVEDIYKMCTL